MEFYDGNENALDTTLQNIFFYIINEMIMKLTESRSFFATLFLTIAVSPIFNVKFLLLRLYGG